MGGCNSGWYGGCGRPARRLCVDEVPIVLTVRDVRHLLGLDPAVVFRVHWTEAGFELQPSAEEPSWLAAKLPSDYAGRVELMRQPWPVARGHWFFVCCNCARPCLILYAVAGGDPLRCRRCCRLTYESAQGWDTLSRRGRLPGYLH
jgi:hypothetical protein